MGDTIYAPGEPVQVRVLERVKPEKWRWRGATVLEVRRQKRGTAVIVGFSERRRDHLILQGAESPHLRKPPQPPARRNAKQTAALCRLVSFYFPQPAGVSNGS